MSDPNARAKRRQLLVTAAAVVGILALVGAGMFLFEPGQPVRRTKPATVNITPPGNVEDRDLWRAHQAAQEKKNEDQLKDLRSRLQQQAAENERILKELEALKKAPDQRSALVEPLPDTAPGGNRQILTPPSGHTKAGALNVPLNAPASRIPKREMEIISFDGGPRSGATTSQARARGTGRSGGVEFIPAGSFVRAAMLNGVDAPTGGQANPHPIVFHLLDPANLPSLAKLNIRDCRVVGAATGDLPSERTIARLETLACILPNGETIEMALKGHAIGEDGKVGIRGRLVTKQGAMLANSLFAGALSGIGRAFQQSAATVNTTALGTTTSVIDPDKVAQAALGGGVAEAANSLAQYYIKAADKLFPIIETDGGRIVELAVTKGAVYTGSAALAGEQYRALLMRAKYRGGDEDD